MLLQFSSAGTSPALRSSGIQCFCVVVLSHSVRERDRSATSSGLAGFSSPAGICGHNGAKHAKLTGYLPK
jgi:hypothetical protein